VHTRGEIQPRCFICTKYNPHFPLPTTVPSKLLRPIFDSPPCHRAVRATPIGAISNPPNGTWLQPSPSRYRQVKRPGKPPFPLVDNTSTCSNNFCFKVSGANERICPDQQDPDIRAPGTPRPSNENYCDTSMRSLLFQWRGVRRGRAPKEFPVSGGMERCIGECT
jgi:hypothetical protein